MRVSVITDDKYLFRFIELKLQGIADTVMGFDEAAEIVFYDCDSGTPLDETHARVIRLSRENSTDAVTLPFPNGFFETLFSEEKKGETLELSRDGKHVFFKNRKIKLTSHEFSLLALLLSGGENYTSRDEIARTVWSDASDGLINIYVHYLREKLESGGEKVIVSSRKFGYRINPIYLGAYNDDASPSGKEGE
ncbi:MAG: hypothetical protein E7673_01180 [Ruminococcaceae bacterium]|nr:hypothetical protein [Oscillospiraceae bacterium]